MRRSAICRRFRDYCDAYNAKHADAPLRFEDFTEPGAAAKAGTEMVHFIGKDIIYFHTLFWPAMLHGSGLRTPTAVHVHGFMTVDGAKMSKSRGTFINARTYLDHLDPDYLRYYLATLLGPTLADIDLDLKAFEERVNSHVVGKWVNIASRTAGFVHKFFGGRLADALPDAERVRYEAAANKLRACVALYEQRDYAAATRMIIEVADEANGYVAEKAPWLLAKDESKARGAACRLHARDQLLPIAVDVSRADRSAAWRGSSPTISSAPRRSSSTRPIRCCSATRSVRSRRGSTALTRRRSKR